MDQLNPTNPSKSLTSYQLQSQRSSRRADMTLHIPTVRFSSPGSIDVHGKTQRKSFMTFVASTPRPHHRSISPLQASITSACRALLHCPAVNQRVRETPANLPCIQQRHITQPAEQANDKIYNAHNQTSCGGDGLPRGAQT